MRLLGMLIVLIKPLRVYTVRLGVDRLFFGSNNEAFPERKLNSLLGIDVTSLHNTVAESCRGTFMSTWYDNGKV